jgi:hypothetical protein
MFLIHITYDPKLIDKIINICLGICRAKFRDDEGRFGIFGYLAENLYIYDAFAADNPRTNTLHGTTAKAVSAINQ